MRKRHTAKVWITCRTTDLFTASDHSLLVNPPSYVPTDGIQIVDEDDAVGYHGLCYLETGKNLSIHPRHGARFVTCACASCLKHLFCGKGSNCISAITCMSALAS